jgi:predicted MPP superfamily phosphohydrolase
MGAHRAGDALLYINPGTGYWGIPFRLGAFPEITMVTLRCADEAGLDVGRARLAA